MNRATLTHRMRFDDVITRLGTVRHQETSPKPPKPPTPTPAPKLSLSRDERRERKRNERARNKVERAEWAIRLGARIRRRREYLGMTTIELARKAGYRNSSHLTEIERGLHVPSDEVLAKICAAMGEPLEDESEVR